MVYYETWHMTVDTWHDTVRSDNNCIDSSILQICVIPFDYCASLIILFDFIIACTDLRQCVYTLEGWHLYATSSSCLLFLIAKSHSVLFFKHRSPCFSLLGVIPLDYCASLIILFDFNIACTVLRQCVYRLEGWQLYASSWFCLLFWDCEIALSAFIF